jgi:hypothetical protein
MAVPFSRVTPLSMRLGPTPSGDIGHPAARRGAAVQIGSFGTTGKRLEVRASINSGKGVLKLRRSAGQQNAGDGFRRFARGAEQGGQSFGGSVEIGFYIAQPRFGGLPLAGQTTAVIAGGFAGAGQLIDDAFDTGEALRPDLGCPDRFLFEQRLMETVADFGGQFTAPQVVAGVGSFNTYLCGLAAQSAPAGNVEGLGKLPGFFG